VRDACSQKVSKNPKIVCAQATLTKTGLSAVRTFRSLGVKCSMTDHTSLTKKAKRVQDKPLNF
jgi:hypothetical protein